MYDERFPFGDGLELGSGMHNLEDHGLNDALSCLRVLERLRQGRLELRSEFANGAVEEWGVTLLDDSPLFLRAPESFADDALDRVGVPPGFELILFEGHESKGLALVLSAGDHDLAAWDFGDRVSSMLIVPARFTGSANGVGSADSEGQ